MPTFHKRRLGWICRAVVLGAAAAIATAAPASAVEEIALHGRTMGTTYSIKYWTNVPDIPTPPALQRSIDELLARIDEQMSTWRPDSELSRFNAAAAGEWFPVSPATAAVARRALELHRLTGGASDVTVRPVLQLWGFGSSAVKGAHAATTPSDPELAAAMARVGAEHLQVRTDPPALRKEVDGLEVDLSSIAAGYAIDEIIDLLADAGAGNAMVELGGEVRGVGVRNDGKPWRIGVQSPPPDEQTIARVVPLENLALATSGDFHNVRTIDGVAYTHIVDPHTGRPLRYRGASVTVVAETCFAADGVATALFVMGPDLAYDWCVEHHVAALFQQSRPDGEGTASRITPRFEELFGHE